VLSSQNANHPITNVLMLCAFAFAFCSIWYFSFPSKLYDALFQLKWHFLMTSFWILLTKNYSTLDS